MSVMSRSWGAMAPAWGTGRNAFTYNCGTELMSPVARLRMIFSSAIGLGNVAVWGLIAMIDCITARNCAMIDWICVLARLIALIDQMVCSYRLRMVENTPLIELSQLPIVWLMVVRTV